MRYGFLLACCWAQIAVEGLRELKPEELYCPGSPRHRSHNNVDLVQYRGLYFLALRTAPTHFPSRKAELRILFSTDLEHWSCDTVLRLGRDVREPRWLVWKDTLYLYFFVGSARPWRFESEGIQGLWRAGQGPWQLLQVGWRGWVPWRARSYDSVAYLTVYWGQNLYSPAYTSEVRLLHSTDGRNWKPITTAPQLTAPFATETDFWIGAGGQLWAIARAEGLGSYLCRSSGIQGPWQHIALPEKYDSPLLVEGPDGLYLIARRNLAGRADKAPRWWPRRLRRMANLALYSLSRKRTALYFIDTLRYTVRWIRDLPGWGDTAFPAAVKWEGQSYAVINYTSPLSGKDRLWIGGQLRPTHLYRIFLRWKASGAELHSP